MLGAFTSAAYAFYTGIQSGAVSSMVSGIFSANSSSAAFVDLPGDLEGRA